MKLIWYFHHYASEPEYSGLIRPYCFAKEFKKYGYKTIVFCSSYLHFSYRDIIENDERYLIHEKEGVTFIYLKNVAYLDNGFKRIANMISFYFSILFNYRMVIKKYGKPDYIIGSSPHTLTMHSAILIAKLTGALPIVEVRDLWPNEIFLSKIVKESSLFGKILVYDEKRMYEKAKAIVFTKEGQKDYIIEKGWDCENGGNIDLKKCYYINNGVDILSFDKNLKENQLDDPDLTADYFNIIYIGAIRVSNNIDNILDCAKLLLKYKNIRFLIYGNGDYISHLKTRIQEEQLLNVSIKGYINRKYIPFILSKSSINLLNYKMETVDWSKGTSSNKLFEYMASGKPIISNVKLGYDPLEKYQCGVSLDDPGAKALAKKILEIKNLSPEEYKTLCINARRGATDFDFSVLSKKYIDLFNNLENNK